MVDGVVKRSAPIRVLRDNVVIYEGELESLRRFKDDVNEVKQGTECGIGVKNYNDVNGHLVGDRLLRLLAKLQDPHVEIEALERIIREAPEQYLWIHRRFKTRPGNEHSPYAR